MRLKHQANKGHRPMPRLFSYVVQHDTGHAPNPYFGVCTLCRCKYRKCTNKPQNVVEKAERGDWIVGTGGANKRKSAGHGKIVYVMRVDDKITRFEYYQRFANKKPQKTGTYKQRSGDNICPHGSFEKNCQFVLLSRHFWYFGRKARPIPKREFPHLEKKGPKYRCDFDEKYFSGFKRWVEVKLGRRGIRGKPCWIKNDEGSARQKEKQQCKSSC